MLEGKAATSPKLSSKCDFVENENKKEIGYVKKEDFHVITLFQVLKCVLYALHGCQCLDVDLAERREVTLVVDLGCMRNMFRATVEVSATVVLETWTTWWTSLA